MDIAIHLQRVENRLSSRLGVIEVEKLLARRLSGDDTRATINAKLRFYDGSFLDIHEIINTYRSYPEYLSYSYQYMKNDKQVFRYDNAPHHPKVGTYPDHKHIGNYKNERVIDSNRPNYNELFQEIYQFFTQETK